MFGLEGDKKGSDFVFDLETEVKDPSIGHKLKDKVTARTKEVKDILRSGDNKEQFDQFGVLLHGYTSLKKVMARVSKK
ncbi:MAG: hypothetical protein K940chlam3_00846 [Chlamydiae bacterium]|nr:hypothetical protein [Chlamydiota bacterium]